MSDKGRVSTDLTDEPWTESCKYHVTFSRHLHCKQLWQTSFLKCTDFINVICRYIKNNLRWYIYWYCSLISAGLSENLVINHRLTSSSVSAVMSGTATHLSHLSFFSTQQNIPLAALTNSRSLSWRICRGQVKHQKRTEGIEELTHRNTKVNSMGIGGNW